MTRDEIVADDLQFERNLDRVSDLWAHGNDTLDIARACGITEAVADSILSSWLDGGFYCREEEAYAAENDSENKPLAKKGAIWHKSVRM